MIRLIFLYTLFTVLLITGCSTRTPEPIKSTPESSKSNLPALDGSWTIKLIHSGGIMGLLRSIEISSDGKYTVMDERAAKTILGELKADELSKLKEQVVSSKYIPAGKLDGMGCADCFIYDLEIQEAGKPFSVQLNDVNLPASGLAALVEYLRGLIDAAL